MKKITNSEYGPPKTRAAKASGVGAVSVAKCGMCMASQDDIYNTRYHPTRVYLGLPDSVIDGNNGPLLVAIMGHYLAVLQMVVEVWVNKQTDNRDC